MGTKLQAKFQGAVLVKRFKTKNCKAMDHVTKLYWRESNKQKDVGGHICVHLTGDLMNAR